MIPTYVIMNGGQSITCLDCGLTSWNENDVRERYCPVCRKFYDEGGGVEAVSGAFRPESGARPLLRLVLMTGHSLVEARRVGKN
jgi:hypothetical protein